MFAFAHPIPTLKRSVTYKVVPRSSTGEAGHRHSPDHRPAGSSNVELYHSAFLHDVFLHDVTVELRSAPEPNEVSGTGKEATWEPVGLAPEIRQGAK